MSKGKARQEAMHHPFHLPEHGPRVAATGSQGSQHAQALETRTYLEEHRAGSDEDDIDHSCVHVHDCSRLRVQGRRVDGESAAIGGLLLARSQQGTDVPSPGLGAGTRAVGCVWRCSKREVADRFANRSLRLGFREGPKLSHIELDLLSALVRQKSCESGHHRVGLGVEDAHERRSQAVSRGDDGLGRKMPQNDGASAPERPVIDHPGRHDANVWDVVRRVLLPAVAKPAPEDQRHGHALKLDALPADHVIHLQPSLLLIVQRHEHWKVSPGLSVRSSTWIWSNDGAVALHRVAGCPLRGAVKHAEAQDHNGGIVTILAVLILGLRGGGRHGPAADQVIVQEVGLSLLEHVLDAEPDALELLVRGESHRSRIVGIIFLEGEERRFTDFGFFHTVHNKRLRLWRQGRRSRSSGGLRLLAQGADVHRPILILVVLVLVLVILGTAIEETTGLRSRRCCLVLVAAIVLRQRASLLLLLLLLLLRHDGSAVLDWLVAAFLLHGSLGLAGVPVFLLAQRLLRLFKRRGEATRSKATATAAVPRAAESLARGESSRKAATISAESRGEAASAPKAGGETVEALRVRLLRLGLLGGLARPQAPRGSASRLGRRRQPEPARRLGEATGRRGLRQASCRGRGVVLGVFRSGGRGRRGRKGSRSDRHEGHVLRRCHPDALLVIPQRRRHGRVVLSIFVRHLDPHLPLLLRGIQIGLAKVAHFDRLPDCRPHPKLGEGQARRRRRAEEDERPLRVLRVHNLALEHARGDLVAIHDDAAARTRLGAARLSSVIRIAEVQGDGQVHPAIATQDWLWSLQALRRPAHEAGTPHHGAVRQDTKGPVHARLSRRASSRPGDPCRQEIGLPARRTGGRDGLQTGIRNPNEHLHRDAGAVGRVAVGHANVTRRTPRDGDPQATKRIEQRPHAVRRACDPAGGLQSIRAVPENEVESTMHPLLVALVGRTHALFERHATRGGERHERGGIGRGEQVPDQILHVDPDTAAAGDRMRLHVLKVVEAHVEHHVVLLTTTQPDVVAVAHDRPVALVLLSGEASRTGRRLAWTGGRGEHGRGVFLSGGIPRLPHPLLQPIEKQRTQ
eukprot:scaffold310_cov307-Pinguiococcus_pyrenoidosus.AAC.17